MITPKILKEMAKRLNLYEYTRWFTAYNKQSLAFHAQFINKGDICFDVGAHIGTETEVYLKLGATKIVAIEPQDVCFSILRDKFETNERVILIFKGLDSKKGFRELSIPVNTESTENPSDNISNTMASMSEEWMYDMSTSGRSVIADWSNSVTVPTTTLDFLISQHGIPNFCKIDVEGFELNVLRGLSHLIPHISFEYTISRLESTLACIEYICSLGNYEFNYVVGSNFEFELKEYVEKEQIVIDLTDVITTRVEDSLESYGNVYARLRI